MSGGWALPILREGAHTMSAHLRSSGVATMLGLCVAACILGRGITLAQSSDPQPQNATTAILAAFDKYEVVAMNVRMR